MNKSSASVASEVDEFELAGLQKLPSKLVKPPRVKDAPAHLECVYLQTIALKDRHGEKHPFFEVVLGQVIGIHIDDRFIADGMVDSAAMKPLSRLGYMDYAVVEEVFEMQRPK